VLARANIEAMTTPSYSWEAHPVAILGTIYLYFAYGRHEEKIPNDVINVFVSAHQDGDALTADKVRAAVQAVRKLDTGNGKFGPSQKLQAIWDAMATIRSQFHSV
jgi:hypothetical protein